MTCVTDRDGTNGPTAAARIHVYSNAMTTEAATIRCPIEHETVDAERCAACARRADDRMTCDRQDRLALNDLRFLLLAL